MVLVHLPGMAFVVSIIKENRNNSKNTLFTTLLETWEQKIAPLGSAQGLPGPTVLAEGPKYRSPGGRHDIGGLETAAVSAVLLRWLPDRVPRAAAAANRTNTLGWVGADSVSDGSLQVRGPPGHGTAHLVWPEAATTGKVVQQSGTSGPASNLIIPN